MILINEKTTTMISHSDVEEHLLTSYKGVLTDAEIKIHLQLYVIGSGLEELQLNEMASCLEPRAKLLDVGSGYGGFVLAARKAGYQAQGIDLAAFEVAYSRQQIERVEPDLDSADVFLHGSALDLPFTDDAFDAVTLWNFLEHVPDYELALKEAVRVLRPGGKIFVLAPNYLALRSEPHYHVFWPSLLPKFLGVIYLRSRGRDPTFFSHDIHYCTNWGVAAALRKLGMRLTIPSAEKLSRPNMIKNAAVRHLIVIAIGFGLSPLIRFGMFLINRNPMRSIIRIHAIKGNVR